MANALGMNLKAGDKLVLNGGVVAIAGGQCFGSFNFTAGRALDVTIDGQVIRADGYDIDRDETLKRFSKENGWDFQPGAA